MSIYREVFIKKYCNVILLFEQIFKSKIDLSLVTGLFAAIPPSTRLNSWSFSLWLVLNWCGGRYVGAADVAMQISDSGAFKYGFSFIYQNEKRYH